MLIYDVRRQGTEISVWRDGEKRAWGSLHEAPGILYASDLQGTGDAGALRALLKEYCVIARDRDVLLHVDAREPDAWRLFRLYSRIGTVEYVSFRMNPL